jgi:hypothetical protein
MGNQIQRIEGDSRKIYEDNNVVLYHKPSGEWYCFYKKDPKYKMYIFFDQEQQMMSLMFETAVTEGPAAALQLDSGAPSWIAKALEDAEWVQQTIQYMIDNTHAFGWNRRQKEEMRTALTLVYEILKKYYQ